MVRFPILDFGCGAGASTLVVGSPRSGTTWLASVIAEMTGARSVFEPFILDRSGELTLARRGRLDNDWREKDRALLADPFLGRTSRYYQHLKALLCGRVRSEWTDRGVDGGFYRRRVVKGVRTNFLLPYIVKTWPRLKIVWLVRDPVSVVASQVTMARLRWGFDGEHELTSEGPVDPWLMASLGRMHESSSFVERLTHKWCIETRFPLRYAVHLHPNVLLVKYHALKSSAGWEPISRFGAGVPWSGSNFEELLRRPSSTARVWHDPEAGAEAGLETVSSQDRKTIEAIAASYDLAEFLGAGGDDTGARSSGRNAPHRVGRRGSAAISWRSSACRGERSAAPRACLTALAFGVSFLPKGRGSFGMTRPHGPRIKTRDGGREP
ncbi:MAG: sulfotransferase [Stellaceae bacterium]